MRETARTNEERRSEGFNYDAKLEHAIKMREDHPDQYAALSGPMKMEVGFYESSKEAANAQGIDVSPKFA